MMTVNINRILPIARRRPLRLGEKLMLRHFGPHFMFFTMSGVVPYHFLQKQNIRPHHAQSVAHVMDHHAPIKVRKALVNVVGSNRE